MIIKSKIESFDKIEEMKLNKFPEKIFRQGQEKDIEKFINKYYAKYYAIRDKSRANGRFLLKVDADNVLNEIRDYSMFSINVSSINYCENQLLVGEILITSDDEVSAILSTNQNFSVRDAIKNPTFNVKTNIFDTEILNSIPYFDEIYYYICRNKLKDVIIEFAYFDIPVGLNNEQIVIYELRTDY